MFGTVLFILLLIGAGFGVKYAKSHIPEKAKAGIPPFIFPMAQYGLWAFALFSLLAINYVVVPPNQVGLKISHYGSQPTNGRVMALAGERGNLTDVLLPGFNVVIGGALLYDYVFYPMVEIPTGYYGRIATRDGKANTTDFTTAPEWSEEEYSKMLDATYFMSPDKDGNTHGTKGLQSSTLKPGRYALNLFLYEVQVGFSTEEDERTFVGNNTKDWFYDINTTAATGRREADTNFRSFMTRIPSGMVGVVRSSISKPGQDCNSFRAATGENGLVAELVHQGCRGVWDTVLNPGDYYMNRDITDVTIVPTRVQTWDFKGCYVRRKVALEVDQKGTITQKFTEEPVMKPDAAADCAVMVKAEGWDVPQELRVLVQIEPKNAPIVVAAVGGMKQIEDSVLVPSIRSIVRNVVGGEGNFPKVVDGQVVAGGYVDRRPTKVNDLIENRPALEATIQGIIQLEGVKTGLDIREVRLGEPALPPEFMVTRLRQQLAVQLRESLMKETLAQNERITTEQARATADQQGDLVKAQIGVKVSAQDMEKRRNQGQAEKDYSVLVAEGQKQSQILIADGQKAQVAVLGQGGTMQMQMFQQALDVLAKHPDMLANISKLVPNTVVTVGGDGNNGGLAGLGAVIGPFLRGATAPAAPK